MEQNFLKLKKSIVAFIISMVIILSVFIFSFFIIYETIHDCSGDNCPICFVINMIKNNFQSANLGVMVLSVIFFKKLLIDYVFFKSSFFILNNSLVKKIRLNI